jgi:galacturonosyltransferase
MDENCFKLENLGAKIIPSHLERRGMNPLKDLKLLLEYLNLLKVEKPDVVLTYTIKPNLYGGLAAALKKIPYLMNITGLGTSLENPGLLGKILLAFYKIVTAKANCVFFQNRGNMQFMQDRGISLKNSKLLPGSGVNLEEHPFEKYPSEENGIRILAVLRVMKDKGIEEYLDAVQTIFANYPNVSFELVGEYEEDSREKYEPVISNLEKQGILKYYGHINNVPEVMANSHIIVHPSYHEGLSNVCLEAAACGRPVLTTDVSGCRETINSTSGILFSARSSNALISALETVLAYTPLQREQMGISGRSYVESNFSRQIVVDMYQNAVNNL